MEIFALTLIFTLFAQNFMYAKIKTRQYVSLVQRSMGVYSAPWKLNCRQNNHFYSNGLLVPLNLPSPEFTLIDLTMLLLMVHRRQVKYLYSGNAMTIGLVVMQPAEPLMCLLCMVYHDRRYVVPKTNWQCWTKCKISLKYSQKICQKCKIFTHFQNFL